VTVPQTARSHLKRKLIEQKLLVEVCAICGIQPFWNSQKLVLHLDHINGSPKDNRLENLRLICPNCHSQTETYAGKKTKGGKRV
jgi:5-methylcytosine-specific restriction endonuclease McrA